MRYVIYTRKSSEEDYRQVLSLEGQKEEMLALSGRNNCLTADVLEESRTAFKPGRPVFNQMIDDIRSGKYDGILCWKLDRLARNFEDAAKIIELLLSEKLKEIRTPDRVFIPADNVVVINLEFAMACQYSRDISSNVKRTNRKKLRDGIWPNRARFGYFNTPIERDIQVDPETAPIYKKAVNLYLSERYSFQDISKLVVAPAIGNWRRSHQRSKHEIRCGSVTNRLSAGQWHRILSSPFYYGVMKYCDVLYFGKHTPLITKEQFGAMQRIMKKKSARKGYNKPFAFRKLFSCGECGRTITLDIQKGIPYWRCTKRNVQCAQRYAHGSLVLDQLQRYIADLTPNEVIPKLLQQVLDEEQAIAAQKAKSQIQHAQTSIQECERKSLGLLDLLLSQTITEDEYRLKRNELTMLIAECRSTIEQLSTSTIRFEPVAEWISELNRAMELQTNEDQEELRNFLEIIGSNHVLLNGTFSMTLKKRWEIWLEWKSRFGESFSKKPVGYQLSLVRRLRDTIRTNEQNTNESTDSQICPPLILVQNL